MNKLNHYLIILTSIVVIVGCGKKETFVFKTNEGAVEILLPGKLKDVKTMKSYVYLGKRFSAGKL